MSPSAARVYGSAKARRFRLSRFRSLALGFDLVPTDGATTETLIVAMFRIGARTQALLLQANQAPTSVADDEPPPPPPVPRSVCLRSQYSIHGFSGSVLIVSRLCVCARIFVQTIVGVDVDGAVGHLVDVSYGRIV
jgi:hypothetical protein